MPEQWNKTNQSLHLGIETKCDSASGKKTASTGKISADVTRGKSAASVRPKSSAAVIPKNAAIRHKSTAAVRHESDAAVRHMTAASVWRTGSDAVQTTSTADVTGGNNASVVWHKGPADARLRMMSAADGSSTTAAFGGEDCSNAAVGSGSSTAAPVLSTKYGAASSGNECEIWLTAIYP